jgi:hypothetical protein
LPKLSDGMDFSVYFAYTRSIATQILPLWCFVSYWFDETWTLASSNSMVVALQCQALPYIFSLLSRRNSSFLQMIFLFLSGDCFCTISVSAWCKFSLIYYFCLNMFAYLSSLCVWLCVASWFNQITFHLETTWLDIEPACFQTHRISLPTDLVELSNWRNLERLNIVWRSSQHWSEMRNRDDWTHRDLHTPLINSNYFYINCTVNIPALIFHQYRNSLFGFWIATCCDQESDQVITKPWKGNPL